MGATRKFTILHSNDMHGDFFAEQAACGGPLTGGLPLLPGYLKQGPREGGYISTERGPHFGGPAPRVTGGAG